MKLPSRADRETRGQLSLGAWFAVFALAVCFAIIAAFIVDTLHERNVAIGVARSAALNLSESLAQQASDTLEGADGALRTLGDRVAQRGLGPAARTRLHDTMIALVTTMPRIHNLIVADERGRFAVANFATASTGMPPVSDRPYFRYHRSHRGLATYISGPAQTKIQPAGVIFATRRLENAHGGFAGVAIAPIYLDYFERSYNSVDIGRRGSITLFAQRGKIVLRRPRALIGHTIPDAVPFIVPYASAQAGWLIRTSRVDGVLRLFAFRRLGRYPSGSYPLVVQVALAESDYLADWRSNTVSNAVAVALIIGMIGGLAAGLGAQMGRRKRAEDSLAQLALTDGLTGLANRRQFDMALEREWRHATRDQVPLALLMIDVDNFKAYNDCYGHQQGDKSLKAIADAIGAAVLRPRDLAARYGGEEFVVILPATDTVNALTVAERIRAGVLALGIAHTASDNSSGIASVSVGVAGFVPPRATEGSTLVEAADSALYIAKRTGRNRTSVNIGEPRAVEPAPTVAR